MTFASLFIISLFRSLMATPQLPGVKTSCDNVFYKEGDVKFGVMFPIHLPSGNSDDTCSDKLNTYGWIIVESFIYTSKTTNEDQHILPNITLGWVVLDTCRKNDLYTARTLQFLADDKPDAAVQDQDDPVCYPDGRSRSYLVAAALAPGLSIPAMFSAHILGLAKIRAISAFAISDELSDKARFPYLVRLAIPDRFQACEEWATGCVNLLFIVSDV